jgi:hypothetical protein
MSDVTPNDALRAFVDAIDLWAEHVLTHADFRADAADSVADKQPVPALSTMHSGYRAFLDGSICDATWRDATRAFRMLMCTPHFRRRWEFHQTEFPEDFRTFVKSECIPGSCLGGSVE